MTTHIVQKPTPKQVQTASQMLKLASEPTRFKILWALLHGEHSVNELAKHVRAQPAAVSQHLAKLRIAKIVTVTREGNRLFYKTDNNHLRRVIENALRYASKFKK